MLDRHCQSAASVTSARLAGPGVRHRPGADVSLASCLQGVTLAIQGHAAMVPEPPPARPAENHSPDRHIGTAYVLVMTAVMMSSPWLLARPVARSGVALPAGIETRLDPNSASAVELSRLPGIGPGLANRIIARRSAIKGGAPAFRSPSDLAGIRGLGARRLDSLRRYLRFPDSSAAGPVEAPGRASSGGPAQPGRRRG